MSGTRSFEPTEGASSATARRALAIHWVAPDTDAATVIGPGVTTLGHGPDDDERAHHVEAPGWPVEIRWAGATPLLRDLDSSGPTGVFVNGRRAIEAPLRLHDVLRLGDRVGVVARADAGNAGEPAFEELAPGYWAGPVLRAALAPLRRLAASGLPIVIQGETGAGKEGAARAVHGWSARVGRFVGLNCAALPEPLADGELFGYRRGAFTGADRAHAGHLRAADRGTLFLDEIVDLPLPVQAKLLRAIEEREVLPLGETWPVPVDARLLVAAQAPLGRAVDEKRFRADLLARLEGFTLVIPPLRERAIEIPFLLTKLLQRHDALALPRRLHPRLVERLCLHRWPFNVRELAFLARRLVALHPDAAVLDDTMWPEPAAAAGAGPAALPAARNRPAPTPHALLAALRANQGNVKRAAAALGISRGKAYRSIERLADLDLGALRRGA